MTLRYAFLHFVSLAAIFIVGLHFATVAYAQEASGIGLSPSLIEESADPGESITKFITVKNLSEQSQTYYLFVRDIAGVHAGGRPIYAEDDLSETGYELSNWVTLTKSRVTIPAKSEEEVGVLIEVPDEASPGSHFGGIFASQNAPNIDTVGAGVGYQVGNIVSIRVSGDALESAVMRSLQTDKYFYGTKDVTFTARVENKGNVLVRPIGPVEIYNMLGDKVVTTIMNEQKNAVFPGTIRPFEKKWTDDTLGFGRYEAVASLVYGEAGEAQSTITNTTTFWVLPWEIIKPLLITLGVLLVVSYFFIRKIIQNQVRRLAGGRRLVRSTQTGGPSILIMLTIVMLVLTAFSLFVLLLLFA